MPLIHYESMQDVEIFAVEAAADAAATATRGRSGDATATGGRSGSNSGGGGGRTVTLVPRVCCLWALAPQVLVFVLLYQ